jgi:hypothetical protein
MITKFNFKFLTQLKGASFVADLKDAVAVKTTWGYEYLRDQRPALNMVYQEAKKLPRTQKEWVEQNTFYVAAENVLDNPEVPQNVQEAFLEIITYCEAKGAKGVKGVFRMPEIRTGAPVWWVWENGSDGQWFKKNGQPAKATDNPAGYYESAVSTYASRIKKNLPLYVHGKY